MIKIVYLSLFLSLAAADDLAESADVQNRTSKFMSLFSVIQFPNTFCFGGNNYNGTCLTSAECSLKGGLASGSCASGFGVCCVFTVNNCQSTITQNCTYWQNPGFSATYAASGQCRVNIQQCDPSVCQIRLDFLSFILSQPNNDGLCTNDLFTVSGTSNSVPTICGYNTGQHMYLDLTPGTGSLQLSIITTGSVTSRSWSIKITQLPCYTSYNAPPHCLQYWTDTTGTISSFNYRSVADSATTFQQLSNQDYTMCVRVNQGFCGICYSTCTDTLNTPSAAFSISGASTSTVAQATALDASCAFDWLQIPCASNQMNSVTQQTSPATTPALCVSKICGGVFASYTAPAATAPVPVYSYSKPFELRFHSDSAEVSSATTETGNLGFCLNYVQQPCVSG